MYLAIATLIVAAAPQTSPEDRGREIALEADRRDSGFSDTSVKLVMRLQNRHGQTSSRDLEIKTLEVEGDGDKSLVYFRSPRDVRGTSFLTFSHSTTADDQWLYLPALRRVKRIASNNKSGPFMGSEFAYEDIASQEVDKYRYKFIEASALDGQPCFVVERYPEYENSGYTKQVVWFDQAEYRVQKVDYYDRKGALLKTLTSRGYEKYLDRYWRAATMSMVNHQTGKSTVLDWDVYKFATGLSAADFNKNRLKRAR